MVASARVHDWLAALEVQDPGGCILSSPRVAAVAALFLSLGGGVALAAAGGCPEPAAAPDTGAHIESGTNALGVDIAKAGNTQESRMVFFGQLSIEEKS